MKRRHLLFLPLLLLTFLLYSTRPPESPLGHGAIQVEPLAGDPPPVAEIVLHSAWDDSGAGVVLAPAPLATCWTMLAQVDPALALDVGLAVLNPGMDPITVELVSPGQTEAAALHPPIRLGPGEKQAFRLSGLFDDRVLPWSGPLVLRSDHPVGVTALQIRGFGLTALHLHRCPNAGPPAAPERLIFPHVVAGGGYRTVLTMWNPHPDPIHAWLTLSEPDGTPLTAWPVGDGSSDMPNLFILLPGERVNVFLGEWPR